MSAVAFDTETKGFAWWKREEQAFLVTWADATGEWWADLSEPDSAQVRRFIEAIKSADVVIGHNLKFDLHQIRATLDFDIEALDKRLEDTDLMSRVLYPEGQNKGSRGGHGLKNLAMVYLRVDAKDPEAAIKEMAKNLGMRTIRRVGAYYDVYRAYPNEMVTYAVADARYTFDLYDKWLSKATDDRVYQMERRVMPILIEAERVGIATDQARVQQFKHDFSAARDELYDRLLTEFGEKALTARKDWDDDWEDNEESENLAEALIKIGIPLHERTKTGKLSTRKFALQEFETDFPIITDLFEYRKLERFLSTFIGAVDGVDIVHPNFSQIGAWTGRMSSRSPNMQNWPKRAGKEVRSVFVPRPGMAFLVYDYEGIEERLLAYYLGDPGYRELAAHYDPHAWLAAQIWGGEPEQYMKGTNLAITHRQPAKNIKYAITYGAGKKRVAAMLRDAGFPSSEDDAAEFISKVKAALPNYYHLTKHRIEPKIKSVGYVNTITGRRNPVNKDKAYVGLNALIQGSAADIFKLGVIAVNEAVSPLGGIPLLFVHDEIVVEVPLEHAEQAGALTEKALVGAWDLNPPLSVEGSIVTTNYGDA